MRWQAHFGNALQRAQIGVARGTLEAGRRWVWQPEQA
jgi:hypothetical protein